MTDDTLKAEVSRIAETIFRRVEFDGCFHKSSLEDELFRWVNDILGQKQEKPAPAEKHFAISRASYNYNAEKGFFPKAHIPPMPGDVVVGRDNCFYMIAN